MSRLSYSRINKRLELAHFDPTKPYAVIEVVDQVTLALNLKGRMLDFFRDHQHNRLFANLETVLNKDFKIVEVFGCAGTFARNYPVQGWYSTGFGIFGPVMIDNQTYMAKGEKRDAK